MDEVDRRILEVLQADGRAPLETIADHTPVSKSTVDRRIDRLEEADILQGYTVEVDESALGVNVTAFLRVHKAPHIEPGPLEDEMADLHEVQEIHRMRGETYWLLKVKSHDLEAFTDLVEGRLTEIHGIDVVRTTISTMAVKETDKVPIASGEE